MGTTRLRILVLLVGLLIVAGLLTACGGGDDDGGKKSRLGESCTKTSDCEVDLRCLDQVCVRDENAPDGGDDSEADSDAADGGDDSEADSDSTNGGYLLWENQGDTEKYTWQEAIDYCTKLDSLDQSDWRVPTITELRSLIRGCSSTETDGSCNIEDSGCLAMACKDESCDGCPLGDGPADRCYWPNGLKGSCSWYWSSSLVEDVDASAWLVSFGFGSVRNYSVDNFEGNLRCVRGTRL